MEWDAETQPQPEAVESAEVPLENQEEDENDVLMAKAQSLIEKITANPDNPSPSVLHALSTLLETEEARYMEDPNYSSSSNGRSSHSVGRLGNLIRENDEFLQLISSKFLTVNRYSISVHAASVRLLVGCSPTWTYPHIFEDDVIVKIRGWVMEEIPWPSSDRRKIPDSEMLRTYSTGLLAVCFACDAQLVENALNGLPSKLMWFLRLRVLGDINTHHKEGYPLNEKKGASNMGCTKAKAGSKVRLRQAAENSNLNVGTLNVNPGERDQGRDPSSIDNADRDRERCFSRSTCGDECWGNEEPPDSMGLEFDACDQAEADVDEKSNFRDVPDSKFKSVGKSVKEEEFVENVRDDSSRRRTSRGLSRSWGKSRAGDGMSETDVSLTSPTSGSKHGYVCNFKDRIGTINQELKRGSDAKGGQLKNSTDFSVPERDEDDDCFQDCKVGSRDITDLVKKAVRSAEMEARADNAPAEAIRAAGDAAAEVVKTAALEEYSKSNDEDAAVAAASKATFTVTDAANAVAFQRKSKNVHGDSGNLKPLEPETNEDTAEFAIPDTCTLAKLREKFCIQCLVILGEYVDVLGPVLHEKGVDVCISLLLRSVKHEPSNSVLLLPDVLKLICALAAHRKFAAVYVDRGGIQRLLGVQRNAQTFFGLSSCLFTLGSIQGIMERVCALPSNVVHQIVELALQLIQCQDLAVRKNAALFFITGFVFRAVIDAFDEHDGLQKLLSILREAASVRSGVSPGLSNDLGSLRSSRSPAELLTSSEKQVAYHTCTALRQYFRAHLRLLVDTIRPSKNIRNAPRNMSRAAYKPLDISNEAMDAVFRQIQMERKLGLAIVRTNWAVVDNFLSSNGITTLLELCQAPPVDRYLHDLLQYALGVLHIVTLVHYSRRDIVTATLSNQRQGIAVILDAANGAGYIEPEIVEPALNVLINLVCPPPSISNKPSPIMQGQQASSVKTGNGPAMECRDRNIERSSSDRFANVGEPVSADRVGFSVASGLVGDRRISLGAGAGSAGLAAQLEQGYHQARVAVRSNNGIKVLLQLLQSRMVTSPAALDCIRALTCRVLLGLARDDAIAQILTKLQVGKKLSELIRDSGSQPPSGDQYKWQAELAKVTMELIGVVTNSGRASTLAASDAATPTLRRIERDAIAAATPISYHPRQLLQLMHEELLRRGLLDSAGTLLREANLTPLPSLAAPAPLVQASGQETSPLQIQWPHGRASCGFLLDQPKDSCDSAIYSLRTKELPISAPLDRSKIQPRPEDNSVPSNSKVDVSSQRASVAADAVGIPSVSVLKPGVDVDAQIRTPIVLAKRKFLDMKEGGSCPPAKRLNTGEHMLKSPVFATPYTVRRSGLQSDAKLFSTPVSAVKDQANHRADIVLPSDFDGIQSVGQISSSQPGLLNDPQPSGSERLTLDSIVLQYLKHQHRQCPAPITTLPPLSLLHPHVCPEPKRNLDAPSNVTSRLSTREFRSVYGGIYGYRKDRQFVYSRFRPWRTCRDDGSSILTCITFLGDANRIAAGAHTGELKVLDSNNNNVLESCSSHQSPVTLLQAHYSGEDQLILSSSAMDVRLWDASSVSGGPKHSFDGIKAAQFSNSGAMFAALRPDSTGREILLYDIHTCQLDVTLTDTINNLSGRGHAYSLVHFRPSDDLLLWNGVLWDPRVPRQLHRFDQFTDYGGGGFHPAGNEVIINSEVWDLRKYRLLRTVPSLNQTVITFNASGDVIYAILRRNLEDVTSVFQTRRLKHPLFSAFRTVDAVNYSDIATIPVDRCLLDFATEPTDSFVGLITLDDQDDMCTSARVYEIGRRKPTDDDSDPDDADSEDEEEDDDGDDDSILEDSDGDSDANDLSNDEDNVNEFGGDEEDNGDFMLEDLEFDGDGILEILTGGNEEDDSDAVELYNDEDEDEDGFF